MLVCLHLKKCEIFGPKRTNHGRLKSAMEKTSYTETSCRYLHQTDFARRSPRSQKNTDFKGVLRGQFASANVRAEQSKEGRDRHCFQFRYTPLPGRQTVPICLSKSMMVAVPTHARAVKNADIQFQRKRGCCPERLHPLIIYLDRYLSISSRILNSCSCSSGVLADRNS